jgi:lipoyl(octanoyl) transferase
MKQWRLLDTGPGNAAWNMAVDEALLQSCIAGASPPVVRLYTWQPAGISLGHFQQPEKSLKPEACRALGLEVARRPSGGRAIWHDREITFSIIAPLAVLGTRGVMDSYRLLAGGIVAGLQLLGLPAELVERSGQSRPPAKPSAESFPAACFAIKSRCDLVIGGKKIVGSAQVHKSGVVLQQNSLPYIVEAEKWGEVFPGLNGQQDGAVGLWQAAGRKITGEEISAALVEGFQSALQIAFVPDSLSEAENARAETLTPACKIEL